MPSFQKWGMNTGLTLLTSDPNLQALKTALQTNSFGFFLSGNQSDSSSIRPHTCTRLVCALPDALVALLGGEPESPQHIVLDLWGYRAVNLTRT